MAQSGSETQVLPQAGDAFTRALAFSDEPDVASNGTGPKKQRSKKPLIIVLVIVLVLAAIGGTARLVVVCRTGQLLECAQAG